MVTGCIYNHILSVYTLTHTVAETCHDLTVTRSRRGYNCVVPLTSYDTVERRARRPTENARARRLDTKHQNHIYHYHF